MRSGERCEIEAEVGVSVKEAILAAGIDEVHGITNCGGCCSCGTCHVIFEGKAMEHLPEIGECEMDLLEIVRDREAGSRLSCQVPVSDALEGISVRIGAEL